MKRLNLLVSCSIVFCLTNVFFIQAAIADYDGGIGYSYAAQKGSSGFIQRYYEFSLKSYQYAIPTSDAPLAEASFLHPSSELNFTFDGAHIDTPFSVFKQSQYSVGYNYVTLSQRFGIGVAFEHLNFEQSGTSGYSHGQSLNLKYYILKGMRIGYTHSQDSFGNAYNDKAKYDLISYGQLFNFDNRHYLRIDLSHDKTVYTYYNNAFPTDSFSSNVISATFYFNKFTGVLVQVGKYSSDNPNNQNGKDLAIGITDQALKNILVGLTYNRYTGTNVNDEDSAGFQFNASVLF